MSSRYSSAVGSELSRKPEEHVLDIQLHIIGILDGKHVMRCPISARDSETQEFFTDLLVRTAVAADLAPAQKSRR